MITATFTIPEAPPPTSCQRHKYTPAGKCATEIVLLTSPAARVVCRMVWPVRERSFISKSPTAQSSITPKSPKGDFKTSSNSIGFQSLSVLFTFSFSLTRLRHHRHLFPRQCRTAAIVQPPKKKQSTNTKKNTPLDDFHL